MGGRSLQFRGIVAAELYIFRLFQDGEVLLFWHLTSATSQKGSEDKVKKTPTAGQSDPQRI